MFHTLQHHKQDVFCWLSWSKYPCESLFYPVEMFARISKQDDYCLAVWKSQKDIYKFIIEFYLDLEPTAGARKTSEKILRITARCIRLDPSCAITKDPYLASFQGTWIHIFLFWTSCSHLISRLD